MSTTEIIALVSVVIGPLLTAISVVWGAAIGRKAGEKQAAASAEAAGEKAATAARKAVTADWEAYSRSMQEDRKMLSERLSTVEARAAAAEQRIDTAETRAVIAEERAIRWESLYRIAVHHMRELIKWAADVSHMGNMPKVPAELQSEL